MEGKSFWPSSSTSMENYDQSMRKLHMMMGVSILGSLLNASMGEECIDSPTRTCTWDIGKMIGFMVMVCMFMGMESSIRGNSKKGGKVAEECTNTRVEPAMMGNGNEIRRMGLVFSPMRMGRSMKVTG